MLGLPWDEAGASPQAGAEAAMGQQGGRLACCPEGTGAQRLSPAGLSAPGGCGGGGTQECPHDGDAGPPECSRDGGLAGAGPGSQEMGRGGCRMEQELGRGMSTGHVGSPLRVAGRAGQGGTGGHGRGSWAQPVMGAGQATQAWPAGQVSRKMRVLEGRGEHLLGPLGRRLHACRRLGCRGPRVRREEASGRGVLGKDSAQGQEGGPNV